MNDCPPSPAPPPIQGAAQSPAGDEAVRPRECWNSEELLGTRDEVFIQHNNVMYRLRRTRQGKLILYK